jgi:chromosomal replication initiation ATPase DnaA
MNLIELAWEQNPLGLKHVKIVKRYDVLKAVSIHTRVSIDKIISHRKDNKTLWARYYYIYISRNNTIGMNSLSSIGKVINRDHTTVINALTRVNDRINSGDPEILEDITAIEAILGIGEND